MLFIYLFIIIYDSPAAVCYCVWGVRCGISPNSAVWSRGSSASERSSIIQHRVGENRSFIQQFWLREITQLQAEGESVTSTVAPIKTLPIFRGGLIYRSSWQMSWHLLCAKLLLKAFTLCFLHQETLVAINNKSCIKLSQQPLEHRHWA